MIPKFRAWHKEYKLMAKVLRLDCINNQVWVDTNHAKDENDEAIVHKWDFDKIELMMCTDLKDMQDIEIYDGDILQLTNPDIIDHKIYMYVKWDKECAKFAFYNLDFSQIVGSFIFCEINLTSMFKIIGNIYENHDILESKQ